MSQADKSRWRTIAIFGLASVLSVALVIALMVLRKAPIEMKISDGQLILESDSNGILGSDDLEMMRDRILTKTRINRVLMTIRSAMSLVKAGYAEDFHERIDSGHRLKKVKIVDDIAYSVLGEGNQVLAVFTVDQRMISGGYKCWLLPELQVDGSLADDILKSPNYVIVRE